MLDKEMFFEKYRIEREFEKSELSWDELERIYDDYLCRRQELENCRLSLERWMKEHLSTKCHSVCSRVKDPEHLIEKIIRKRAKEQSKKYRLIDVSNYCEIIHDLIGVRVLVLSKEEWESIFDWITSDFDKSSSDQITMAEPPIAYTRYGDRDIFKGKIHMEHTNKGYRSQHYIVKYKGVYCEIQVRTLAEEVYGEFDHRVKYPYRDDNKFLKRYTSTVSQLLDSVDEMMSTCIQMGDDGWKQSEGYYENDRYIDWQHTSQTSAREKLVKTGYECNEEEIDIVSYANTVFLRKE